MSGLAGTVKIMDLSASKALRDYAEMRALKGKGVQRTMRNIMRIWVGYAYKRIEKNLDGSPHQIQAELMKIVSHGQRMRKAKGKSADAYRGTLAARLTILFAKDPAAMHSLKGAAFYNKVRAFVNTRRATSGHHRAGLIPAMRALRATVSDRPKIKHPAGGFTERVLDAAAEMLAENWAAGRSKKSVGIGVLVPDAFSAVVPALEAKLVEYFLADIKAGAKAAGLTVDP